MVYRVKDNKSLNQEMIFSGFAWVYPKYCKDLICQNWSRLEAVARENKVGLWRDVHAVPPWEFRHTRSQGGEKRVSSQTGMVYHGNKKSRVFHHPGVGITAVKTVLLIFNQKTRLWLPDSDRVGIVNRDHNGPAPFNRVLNQNDKVYH